MIGGAWFDSGQIKHVEQALGLDVPSRVQRSLELVRSPCMARVQDGGNDDGVLYGAPIGYQDLP